MICHCRKSDRQTLIERCTGLQGYEFAGVLATRLTLITLVAEVGYEDWAQRFVADVLLAAIRGS